MYSIQWLVPEDACCHDIPSGALQCTEWPLSVNDLAGTQRFVFQSGNFRHHMLKPLPRTWHEHLGPTKPVCTFNVCAMSQKVLFLDWEKESLWETVNELLSKYLASHCVFNLQVCVCFVVKGVPEACSVYILWLKEVHISQTKSPLSALALLVDFFGLIHIFNQYIIIHKWLQQQK